MEEHFADIEFDVLSIRNINPAMPDEEIFASAKTEDRMIITMDKDFGELVYHSFITEEHPGVTLLRMEEALAAEKIEVLEMIFSAADQLPN